LTFCQICVIIKEKRGGLKMEFGWECKKCHNIYAPYTPFCIYCWINNNNNNNNNKAETPITNN